VLAEDLLLVDTQSTLWDTARPLLEVAVRLEQGDDIYAWHGWDRRQIDAFLARLPAHCTLIAGVWETVSNEDDAQDKEQLVLCCICEVIEGQIHSIRTYEAFSDESLPSLTELEPGFEDARLLMNCAREHIAPVAWALFTDKDTWEEWIFTAGEDDSVIGKGELLASLARQGRCVLMGSQVAHNHH
jgi:hypothetical protein